jgi:ribosome-associated toxin RatA of RatAB toxin-antitoxin module
MTIVDERFIAAPAGSCFRVAADVERWPDILPHYRYVRFLEKDTFGRGVVAMSAWRDFGGPLRWPTWWTSQMRAEPDVPAVHYQHIAGITRGMTVTWSFVPRTGGTHVSITHEWHGPPWPLIGGIAWKHVIAPFFVSVIAQRTLAGVAAEAERVVTLHDGVVRT